MTGGEGWRREGDGGGRETAEGGERRWQSQVTMHSDLMEALQMDVNHWLFSLDGGLSWSEPLSLLPATRLMATPRCQTLKLAGGPSHLPSFFFSCCGWCDVTLVWFNYGCRVLLPHLAPLVTVPQTCLHGPLKWGSHIVPSGYRTASPQAFRVDPCDWSGSGNACRWGEAGRHSARWFWSGKIW